MGDFFSYEWIPILLNMSLTASAVILCVLLVRLLLCRAPRVFSYALWAVVLFRLLCPVSLTAGFSLLGLTDAPVRAAAAHATVVEYVPQDVVHAPEPQVVLPVPDGVNDALNTVLPQGEEQTAADPLEAPVAIAALVWLAGVLAMAGYSAVSLVRLRRRLAGAVPLEGNVWLADHISTPFVLGLFRPRIYLPSALPEGERSYILLHERHHIRRLDHIVKLIAFSALCVHWFNPLVWLAFVLLGRDMEMSCDEAVLKKLGESVRADYSASLLSLATGRRIIAGTPLAFGEGDTGSRVKNVLRWRRPRTGLVLLAAAVCVAVIAACAANPREDGGEVPGELAGTYASMEDFVREAMSADTVTYYTTDGREATAQVTAAKLAWLEKVGEVEGLAPEGTLEAWGFNYLVQVDADDVMLVGGMYEEDGWYDLEGQGGHDLVALRYPDGSYDILYDAIVNDGLDFYGYHHSYEEAIYDWYVAEYGLDLPLYVEDWIDRVEVPEGGSLGNLPAHRFDGDGWYLYIPVSAWDRAAAEDPENQWQWVSGYGTGSCLLVDRFTTSVHDQQTVCRKQGFVSADESGTVWSHPDRNTRYYLHELPDGGSIRVTIDYDDGRITDYPYIAMEPQVLRLMAESFTVDSRITAPDAGPEQISGALAAVRENDPVTLSLRQSGGPAAVCDDCWGTADALRSLQSLMSLTWTRAEPLDAADTEDLTAVTLSQVNDWSITAYEGREEVLFFGPTGSWWLTADTQDASLGSPYALLRGWYDEAGGAPQGSAGVEPLSDEEVADFNERLQSLVWDRQGDLIGVNAVSCFFTSYYDDVTELDFEEFMRYFPGDGSQTSEAEFQALKDVEGWPFQEVGALSDMPVPVHRYPRRLVDLILGEYVGITTADLDTSSVAYLPEYDAYYNYTSDFGPGIFTCTWGERNDDLIRLYQETGERTIVLTLRELDEETWHIVSFRPAEG